MTRKEAIEIIKEWYFLDNDKREILEQVIPELKESEDEKVRKELIEHIKANCETGFVLFQKVSPNKVLAWLEKQSKQKPINKVVPKFRVGDTMRTLQEANDGYTDGMPVVVSIDNEYYHCTNELIAIKDQDDYEFPPINVKQKSADKVESKFKDGDWIVSDYNNVAYIESISETKYNLQCIDGFHEKMSIEYVDRCWHLWAIKDAKEGDVLVDVHGNIGIFQENYDFDWTSYCSLGCNGGFQNFKVEHENDKTHPATKEQRETLFVKMKESGYEWDAEKKELKNIEQVPIDKIEPKFKPGDKLVSTKNPRLTYKVLNVGNVNELGNLEYEIEIFIDEKPGIQVGGSFKEHNIHLMECVKVDKWAKLIDEVEPKWTNEDEKNLLGIIDEIKANKSNAPDYDIKTYDRFLSWLKSLKQRIERQQ